MKSSNFPQTFEFLSFKDTRDEFKRVPLTLGYEPNFEDEGFEVSLNSFSALR